MTVSTGRRRRKRGWRQWAWGAVAATGLVAVYFLALRPLRVAFAHGVLDPLFARIVTERAASFSLVTVPGEPVLRILDLFSTQYYVGGGLYFWAPAAFLLLLAPRRPYWLIHGALMVTLSLVGLACFAIGYGWSPWGFEAQRFVEVYLLRTLSIGYPLFVLYGPRLRGPAEHGPALPDATS